MTRARRIARGERTHADRQPDDDTVVGHTVPWQQTDEPLEPDRMCKQCEKAAEAYATYGVVIASSGLGHFTADAGTTLCGRDTASMTLT